MHQPAIGDSVDVPMKLTFIHSFILCSNCFRLSDVHIGRGARVYKSYEGGYESSLRFDVVGNGHCFLCRIINFERPVDHFR